MSLIIIRSYSFSSPRTRSIYNVAKGRKKREDWNLVH